MMTTADWALIISLCSFFVSLAGFIWNVWSKFIYPKAKVSVQFSVNTIFGGGNDGFEVIALHATNHGPGDVTLYAAIGRSRKRWFKKLQFFILNPLHNFPLEKDRTIGIFSGGLPKKVGVGESFTAYFTLRHESLRDDPVVDVGFEDTFGRRHWAPRKAVVKVRKAVVAAFQKA